MQLGNVKRVGTQGDERLTFIRSYFIRISHQRPQGAYCSASRL
jgi:hypothetical protein